VTDLALNLYLTELKYFPGPTFYNLELNANLAVLELKLPSILYECDFLLSKMLYDPGPGWFILF